MATYTGSIPVTVYDYNDNPSTAFIEMKIDYTDVTNEALNQRTVTAVVYVKANGDTRRGKWDIQLQMEPNAAVTLSTGTVVYEVSQGWVEVLRDTRTYTNNGDGTLSIRFKTSGSITSSSYGTLTFSADKTVAMTTVPRESLISSSTGKITVNGSNQIQVSINQRATTAYHKLVWKFGSYSYTANVSGSTAGYAIPMEWLNAIPNAMQGGGEVLLYTYSDESRSNQMGSAVSAPFTLVVPDSAKPTLNSGWLGMSPYNTGSGADSFSIYIQNFSRIQFYYDLKYVTSHYGATLNNPTFTVLGTTTNASPWRSPVLMQSGRFPVICTVTDSRGLSASYTSYVDVLPYTSPSLSGCVLLRSANNGWPNDRTNGDEEGTYLFAQATAVAASGIGVRSLKLGYRERNTGDYTYVSMTSGAAKVVGNIDIKKAYDAVIVVTDNCGVTFTYSAVIPYANPTVNFLAGGNGMGIGAYAESENVLKVGWQLSLDNRLVFKRPWTGILFQDAAGNQYFMRVSGGTTPYLQLITAPAGTALDNGTEVLRVNGSTGRIEVLKQN